jgi:hypothetical protein
VTTKGGQAHALERQRLAARAELGVVGQHRQRADDLAAQREHAGAGDALGDREVAAAGRWTCP